MPDLVDLLAAGVSSKLRELGFSVPSLAIIRTLLDTAYRAGLRTEEGKFVRGSITYADPVAPDVNPPFRRRADYPGFTKFAHHRPLTVDTLVKLSRAIDRWSASIAVWGAAKATLSVWGVVDQLVQQNVRLNRERQDGFTGPGILTVNMDGMGDLSVYHGDFFLGAIRSHELVTRENDVLGSAVLASRILPALRPYALAIAKSLDSPGEVSLINAQLFDSWSNTIARICIGLRRLNTGGSLLITPAPIMKSLKVSYRLPYRRLGDSLVLQVLDERYLSMVRDEERRAAESGTVPRGLTTEMTLAHVDAKDRETEVGGGVKLVSSLASADGAVLLTPELHVVGFGVKIGPGQIVSTVYDGPSFARKRTASRKVNLENFGTRHGSMLRYCRLDPAAVGVIVSQDGQVRVVMAEGRSVTLWSNVKLLGHFNCSARDARDERDRRTRRATLPLFRSFGYTSTPKTRRELLASTIRLEEQVVQGKPGRNRSKME